MNLKLKLNNWNMFEVIWLSIITILIFILSIFWKSSLLGITVYVTGVICVVLAAKGNIWNYSFGIYNSIAYAWLCYHNGLYGEVMLNILFFVPTGVIGWLMWRKKMHEHIVIMKKMKLPMVSGMIIICAVATVIYGLWLSTLKGQNTPYLDALNVVVSIIATLAMMFRYREQWILYVCINIAETIMWIIRLMNGSSDAVTMLVMWIAYLVNSFYGLYVWYKGANLSANPKKNIKPKIA